MTTVSSPSSAGDSRAATVDFIGAGWSFPLGVDATGGIALVRREQEVDQAIRLILGTARGERPMRPDFGCRIHDDVFAPANAATAGQVAYDVRQALEQWEPRIEVQDVSVSFDQIEAGTLYIDVLYVIRGLNDPRNLVYPFYVIPQEGEEDGTAVAAPAVTRGPEGP
jgi:phage baseplate assembly protein W